MLVLVWIQTGFAMVILSAALRGIPEETVEAAIVEVEDLILALPTRYHQLAIRTVVIAEEDSK